MSDGFDLVDIIEHAVQSSGGQTALAEDITKARRALRIIMERWTAQRFNTWRLSNCQIALAGNPKVRLDHTVDDVFQVNVSWGQGGGQQSPMSRIGVDQYSELTNKLTAGRPTQYYLNRTEPPDLFIYPIGNPGDVLDVWYVERPAAFDVYGTDVDAPSRWTEALVKCVALELARTRKIIDKEGNDIGYNESLIARLEREAGIATELAQNADRQRVSYRFRIPRRY